MNPNIGKKKLKTFRVNYYFTGSGKAKVEAKTAKEAEKKWRKGDIIHDQEDGDDYCLDNIEEMEE